VIWTVFSLVWKTSIFVGFSVCFIENLELLSKVFNLILVIFFLRTDHNPGWDCIPFQPKCDKRRGDQYNARYENGCKI